MLASALPCHRIDACRCPLLFCGARDFAQTALISILKRPANYLFHSHYYPRPAISLVIVALLRSLYQTSMSAFSAPLALSAIPLPLLVLAGAVLFLLLKYRDGRAIGTDKRDDVRTIRGIPLIGLPPFFCIDPCPNLRLCTGNTCMRRINLSEPADFLGQSKCFETLIACWRTS